MGNVQVITSSNSVLFLQVTLSARGVKILVDLLSSKDNETKVLSASLLASLAHTRAGIPDAMIVVGMYGSAYNLTIHILKATII